jgi:hypothetical protein
MYTFFELGNCLAEAACRLEGQGWARRLGFSNRKRCRD